MSKKHHIGIHFEKGGDIRFSAGGHDLIFHPEVPARRSREEAWEILERKIRGGHVIPIRKKRPPVRALRFAISTAATLTLLLSLSFYFLYTGTRTRITAQGESLSLLLPDSSEVILNGSSILHYNTFLWHLGRKISLKGEAFFRVRKGKRFTVTTEEGQVTVLGTRFTVFSRNDRFRVQCYSGKVRVAIRGESTAPVILTRGLCVEKDGSSGADIPALSTPASRLYGWTRATISATPP